MWTLKFFLSTLVRLNLPQENAQMGHILKSVLNTLTTLKYSVNPSISIQQKDTRKKYCMAAAIVVHMAWKKNSKKG